MTEDSAHKVRALVEEYIEERKREMAPPRERVSRRTRRVITGVALGVLGAAVWFVPIRRAPKPLQSHTRAEAALRVEAVLAATRIRAYQSRHGRLPATLAEAGVQAHDMLYTRVARDAFTLVNSSGALQVTYQSSAPDTTQVRKAFRVLETKS